MEKVIETKNLTKHFGMFSAVEDVSLCVRKGEIYGFLGLNGAGKTTTIRMLLGLITPTRGDARICGVPIRPGGRGPWHLVGSLVEVPYSYPELTVRENLEIIRRMRGIRDSKSVDTIIDQLKLSRYTDRKAGHLSLGNSQRLGLAKALIHKPEILILDEPANGLDPAGIVEIRRLLIDLSTNHSVTIFVSSHILDEVARLATRIGIIHDGRLLREMETSELHSLRGKHLLVGTRNNAQAQELLVSKGYSVTSVDSELLQLTDDHAVLHPDTVATLLVQACNPPTALLEKEDNLETFFLRIVENKENYNE